LAKPLLTRIIEMRGSFFREYGFPPDRLLLSPDDWYELPKIVPLVNYGGVFNVRSFLGMSVEASNSTKCSGSKGKGPDNG